MASGDTLVVWLPQDNQPPQTNYATIDVRNFHPILAFDDTTGETAVFTCIMPSTYAGGNITVYTHWVAVATSGTVGWLAAFETDAAGGQDIDSDGFAGDQTITAATVPAASGVVAVTSVTVTAGANTDSVAAGDLFRVRIVRNVAADSAVGDAQLLGLRLLEA
jgi:hypothetical protein